MIFLFFNLKALTEYEALLEVVALSFRPLLYGLVLYEICGKGKNEKGPSPKNPPSVNQTPTETLEVRLRAAGLTIREVQIALLVHTGLSNKEIAEELYIAETTVKKHLSNIFDKLGVEKRSLIK